MENMQLGLKSSKRTKEIGSNKKLMAPIIEKLQVIRKQISILDKSFTINMITICEIGNSMSSNQHNKYEICITFNKSFFSFSGINCSEQCSKKFAFPQEENYGDSLHRIYSLGIQYRFQISACKQIKIPKFGKTSLIKKEEKRRNWTNKLVPPNFYIQSHR